MDSITIPIVIGEDRHLNIQLPAEVPLGPAELVVRPRAALASPVANPAREAARTKLMAAGKLVTNIHAPTGTVPLTPEERMRLGRLPPGAPSSEALVDQDRGSY